MDEKHRWGGILEVPLISKIQRNILDPGRVQGMRRALSSFDFSSVLDIGCGLGETSKVFDCPYYGADNSFGRAAYAARHYRAQNFCVADAQRLPFQTHAFDAVIMIDTSHHLSDEMFSNVLKEMRRVASRYVVVSDPVCFAKQSVLSRYFYSLDRGGCFRTEDQMKAIFASCPQLTLISRGFFTAFPDLYRHGVFVFKIQKS